MSKLYIPDITMEVMTATAEVAGIDAGNLPDVIEHGGPNNLEFITRRSRQLLEFRDGIVCEGRVAIGSITVGLVTKGIIELEQDEESIQVQKASLAESFERWRTRGVRSSGSTELDLVLSPKLLLLNILIPDRHRIIELGQIAADSPDLRGVDSHVRMRELLARHPANLRRQI